MEGLTNEKVGGALVLAGMTYAVGLPLWRYESYGWRGLVPAVAGLGVGVGGVAYNGNWARREVKTAGVALGTASLLAIGGVLSLGALTRIQTALKQFEAVHLRSGLFRLLWGTTIFGSLGWRGAQSAAALWSKEGPPWLKDLDWVLDPNYRALMPEGAVRWVFWANLKAEVMDANQLQNFILTSDETLSIDYIGKQLKETGQTKLLKQLLERIPYEKFADVPAPETFITRCQRVHNQLEDDQPNWVGLQREAEPLFRFARWLQAESGPRRGRELWVQLQKINGLETLFPAEFGKARQSRDSAEACLGMWQGAQGACQQIKVTHQRILNHLEEEEEAPDGQDSFIWLCNRYPRQQPNMAELNGALGLEADADYGRLTDRLVQLGLGSEELLTKKIAGIGGKEAVIANLRKVSGATDAQEVGDDGLEMDEGAPDGTGSLRWLRNRYPRQQADMVELSTALGLKGDANDERVTARLVQLEMGSEELLTGKLALIEGKDAVIAKLQEISGAVGAPEVVAPVHWSKRIDRVVEVSLVALFGAALAAASLEMIQRHPIAVPIGAAGGFVVSVGAMLGGKATQLVALRTLRSEHGENRFYNRERALNEELVWPSVVRSVGDFGSNGISYRAPVVAFLGSLYALGHYIHNYRLILGHGFVLGTMVGQGLAMAHASYSGRRIAQAFHTGERGDLSQHERAVLASLC